MRLNCTCLDRGHAIQVSYCSRKKDYLWSIKEIKVTFTITLSVSCAAKLVESCKLKIQRHNKLEVYIQYICFTICIYMYDIAMHILHFNFYFRDILSFSCITFKSCTNNITSALRIKIIYQFIIFVSGVGRGWIWFWKGVDIGQRSALNLL